MDSPWQRLPWTLPAALLIWAAALWGLANFMGKPTQRPAEPPPIEAQLLDQYYPTQSSQPGPPAAMVQPQPAPVRPQVTHRIKKNPVAPKAEVITKSPVAVPAAAAPSGARVGEDTPEVKTSGNTGAQAGSYDGKGPPRGNMYGSSGARAIIHPMPQIPEELREVAFNSAALVRFHIAVDGSVEVELVKPTPNPLLNRILLDSLKKWRFMPAIKSGKPVATTEEILVKIEVR
jgi:periplasmic protein TonB